MHNQIKFPLEQVEKNERKKNSVKKNQLYQHLKPLAEIQ